MISNWSNLVARRDLLRELTLSELRSQSQQTRFGWVWWLVDPIITMLIYWAVVVGIFGRGQQYDPYPIFILCALLPFKQFTGSLTACSNVLRNRESLIKSIAFPTMVLPLTIVLSRFWHFVVGTLALVLAAAVFGRPVNLAVLQLLPLMVLQLIVTAGFALAIACAGALIRDLTGFLGHVTRVGFYASPTLYGLDMVFERSAEIGGFWGEWIPRLFVLNPFAGLITGFRDAVFYGRAVESWIWSLLVVQAGISILVGYLVYQHFDRRVIKFL